MVKVKVVTEVAGNTDDLGFNHPMVKVKATQRCLTMYLLHRFNHPMVKVKAVDTSTINTEVLFQPPYGES